MSLYHRQIFYSTKHFDPFIVHYYKLTITARNVTYYQPDIIHIYSYHIRNKYMWSIMIVLYVVVVFLFWLKIFVIIKIKNFHHIANKHIIVVNMSYIQIGIN